MLIFVLGKQNGWLAGRLVLQLPTRIYQIYHSPSNVIKLVHIGWLVVFYAIPTTKVISLRYRTCPALHASITSTDTYLCWKQDLHLDLTNFNILAISTVLLYTTIKQKYLQYLILYAPAQPTWQMSKTLKHKRYNDTA